MCSSDGHSLTFKPPAIKSSHVAVKSSCANDPRPSNGVARLARGAAAAPGGCSRPIMEIYLIVSLEWDRLPGTYSNKFGMSLLMSFLHPKHFQAFLSSRFCSIVLPEDVRDLPPVELWIKAPNLACYSRCHQDCPRPALGAHSRRLSAPPPRTSMRT